MWVLRYFKMNLQVKRKFKDPIQQTTFKDIIQQTTYATFLLKVIFIDIHSMNISVVLYY